MPHARVALLVRLRSWWLHMVSRDGRCEVYVGGRGGGQWGNHVMSPEARTRGCHEIAVVAYGEWLLSHPTEMANVRHYLRGRVLGCHCRPGRDLPCHAEVLAAVANCTPEEYRLL